MEDTSSKKQRLLFKNVKSGTLWNGASNKKKNIEQYKQMLADAMTTRGEWEPGPRQADTPWGLGLLQQLRLRL
jgi:hypothetical protein